MITVIFGFTSAVARDSRTSVLVATSVVSRADRSGIDGERGERAGEGGLDTRAGIVLSRLAEGLRASSSKPAPKVMTISMCAPMSCSSARPSDSARRLPASTISVRAGAPRSAQRAGKQSRACVTSASRSSALRRARKAARCCAVMTNMESRRAHDRLRPDGRSSRVPVPRAVPARSRRREGPFSAAPPVDGSIRSR